MGSSKGASVRDLPYRLFAAVARSMGGTVSAIRARPQLFLAVALGVFVLDIFLPPTFLSLARKPWDYFAFNPWLSRLPEYLASGDVPLQSKLEFLPKLALFWFSANDRHGFVEWGFTVDVSDLLRFGFTALVVGAYFALWFYRRDRAAQCGWTGKKGGRGGMAGALASILGLSTGPCSVMGCGAPVLPVVALAFAGLSSETLRLLAGLSKVSSAVVLTAMSLGVAYFGWTVGARPGVPGGTGGEVALPPQPPGPAGSPPGALARPSRSGARTLSP